MDKKLKEMLANGDTLAQMVYALNVEPIDIRRRIIELGLEEQAAYMPNMLASQRRGRWMAGEVIRLIAMLRGGNNFSQISVALGKPASSIASKVRQLGVWDIYESTLRGNNDAQYTEHTKYALKLFAEKYGEDVPPYKAAERDDKALAYWIMCLDTARSTIGAGR